MDVEDFDGFGRFPADITWAEFRATVDAEAAVFCLAEPGVCPVTKLPRKALHADDRTMSGVQRGSSGTGWTQLWETVTSEHSTGARTGR
ncbi:hypothetical protein NG2371_07180 [Nocardia gamkensis]|nr:hypothetical protein [Nocardia gamkensis]